MNIFSILEISFIYYFLYDKISGSKVTINYKNILVCISFYMWNILDYK